MDGPFYPVHNLVKIRKARVPVGFVSVWLNCECKISTGCNWNYTCDKWKHHLRYICYGFVNMITWRLLMLGYLYLVVLNAVLLGHILTFTLFTLIFFSPYISVHLT